MDPQLNRSVPCYFPLFGRKIDGAQRPMTIKVNLSQSKNLQALRALDSTTLLATLGAAWGLVLGCYTGANDVSFGYYEPSTGSSVDGSRLSAAHLDLARNSTLGELMESAKGEYCRNPSSEHNPSVGTFKPEEKPLFNTILALRTSATAATAIHPVAMNGDSKLLSKSPNSFFLPENCRIRILAKCINSTVSIFLEWWSSEMTTEQAMGIGSTLDKALYYIVTAPHTLIEDFDPFTDYHKQQILRWNSSKLQKVDRCIHDVIHEQTLKSPNEEAVCSWDGSFTFHELDMVSSNLARHLVSIGVGLETRVPLCFDKSKWNVVAMIAVMKAGGAFVPLDPSHPTSRLRNLADAVGASIILCSRHHAENLQGVADVVVPVDFDTIDRLPAAPGHANDLPNVTGSNAAYVIFTSGSTGEPKGTLLEHAAYCTSAEAHTEPLHMSRGSRVLQFAAYTFDASIIEMLSPLMTGACVCIPSEEARLNNIAQTIREMRVDHASFTPSFVNFLEPADIPSVKTMILAGEAMSQAHVEIWSKINLVNGFGPSECAVSASINPHVTPQTDSKDIGFPVGGHCWIVDPENHDRLVPPGSIGELIVEGYTLARCYLNNPAKTADSFLTHLAWAKSDDPASPPRRFYKTGDLVRYNSAKGSLNYVGRKDTQVKLHGQRIELGEIEHHLSTAPGVKHGLVLLPPSGPCKKRLVAIFSLAEETPTSSETNSTSIKLSVAEEQESYKTKIREYLLTRLPTYMVPTIWLCVESMPVLSSKKLDRKRISEWVKNLSHVETVRINPKQEATMLATGVEGQLQRIWSRVLNLPLDQLALDQSFLSLGGDSITAMTCMNQCKKEGLGVTVQEVLKSKSIKELTTKVKAVEQHVEYREETGRDFELSPIQQFHFQVRQEEQGHFNQSFYLRLARAVDKENVHAAVTALVKRHSMLRARFSQAGPDEPWQQRITDDTTNSYRFRYHEISDRGQAESIMADSQRSLNAINGPLFSVDLIKINGQEQVVFGTGHHLIIDLVSWRVILEDLEELLLDPTKHSLAVSIPFQTWTALQKEHCRGLSTSYVMPAGDIPKGDLAYWGVDSKDNTYGNSACEGFEVDSSTTSRLLTESHSALRTELIDILVAVLLHSFGQTFKDRAVPAIYNEGHGREPWDDSIDISRTVGWFTTVYPIFTEISDSESLIDVITRVKDIRRRVPGNGRPYFASRFLTSEGKNAFNHHSPMEVSFNYLGLYQQLEREDAILQPVNEMAGEAREAGGSADFSPTTPRFGLFEISAVVVKGKLRFSFTFNRHMKHQNAIRQWISQCQAELNSAPAQLVGMPFTPTLSDFPLLSLTYDGLKSMVTQKFPQIGVSTIAEVEDAYPCSPMQLGLLLSRTKDDDFYAVRGTYEVVAKGGSPVNAELLATAWKQVVKRHAALRTVFVEGLSTGGAYDQVVLKEIDSAPVRLSCTSDADVLQELEKQGIAQYKDHEPHHRFTICETSSGKVFCRIELSHAIMDGDSVSIIFQDLAMAYSGHAQVELESVYSRFMSHLQSQPSQPSIEFWSSYLDEVEPCHFPILNDGVTTVNKELRTLRLQYKELSALQHFCDSNGFTLPNAMHAAWGVTLNNFIGAEDVCFGYLTSGRDAPIPGINDAVGPFINMLACRVTLPEDTTLLKVLDQVQKDYMESLPHKHVSLAEVQHALKLSGGTPLFNTCISYRRLPPKSHREEPTISFAEHCPIHDPTEYPVSINIEVSDEDVAIDLDYWTDSISDPQAQNISKNFMRALENIANNSQEKLKVLDNLSSGDYDQIWAWNSNIPETINDCVHEVIARRAELHPDAAAICAWDGEFTYRELDTVATRLSEYLVALGVMPETFVPTCFDKSAYAVISMLAVIKAGAACVPLDATHPKTALETRVLDTEAQIVISSPARAPIFEDMVPYVLPISEDSLNEIPEYGCAPTPAHPVNPAFVIFTSGSTGRPKGVVLEHRSMVTSAEAHGSALGVGPETRFLQFAAYTFDNSLEEMFTTLMRGGCVCVPSEDDRFNDLAGAINRLNVNFMDLTPTVATFLKPSDVPNVKGMAIGGEAMTKRVQEIWGGAIPIHNQYGPSECSINCTHNGETGHIEDISNIGRSVGSVSWIVSPSNHNKLVPVGCVGELLVEGPIVARGYLNNPEKTSESFIENPDWVSLDPNIRSTSPRRMYKTGDLVRYNSDGTMCYLGRKDNQVKLNGQRIELGEIEHHVKSHLPASAQSAVQLIKAGGFKALAAFLWLEEEGSVPVANIDEVILPMSASTRTIARSVEAAVSNVLPSYMIPTVFIPVRKMPMTSSGKLDRRALLTAAESLSDAQSSSYRLGGSGGRTPTTEIEIVLQQLWGTVLSKPAESISADDSFFRLGGDSIGAMKLVSAARAKGISLTVATIFQKPKLADMANASDASGSRQGQSGPIKEANLNPFELVPQGISVNSLLHEVSALCQIDSASVEDIYPCTPLQGGLVALSNKQPGAYVAQNVFQLPPDIDLVRFRKAWQNAADSEVVLRTRIVFTESLGFLQVVVKEALEWDLFEGHHQIKEDHSHLPVHDGGVLSRYAIVDEGKRGAQFVWTAHHALYDGWSIPTLLERVAAYYRNSATVDDIIGTTFPHFVRYISSVDPKESDEFWKARLEDPTSPAFPALPDQSCQVSVEHKLSRDVHLPASTNPDITIASMVRAAWALVLSLYTYCDDVIFGEILTGRDAPVVGIEDMVGPTLTSIPSRVHINRELTVADFLHAVQKEFSEAMPYQFAGLQRIKRLGSGPSLACEFQNALAITQDADESADGFWNPVGDGPSGSGFYTYPLNLSCTISRTLVKIDAYYDHNIISTWQVEKILAQLEVILNRIASQEFAQEIIGDMTLIGLEDSNEVQKSNAEAAKYVDRCIHDIIQEQARSDPHAMAIRSWDASFSYQELDELSTALAYHLIGMGITPNPEVVVPLCFEKSAYAVIAMVAVLKSGAAIVSIDPEHPASRLREILNDVRPPVILCSPKYRGLCESLTEKVVPVSLDILQRATVGSSPLPTVPASNAAYIVFTSGSTGKPKGSIIEHGTFASSSVAHFRPLGLVPKSRVLQFAAYTFDASLVEILTVLMIGSCICVPTDIERMNDIGGYINRMQIENVSLTPSFAQLLSPEDIPSVKTLSLVGEPMSMAHVSTWASKLNLVNGYGPSECSVTAVINRGMKVGTHPANIGRPIDRCWVVDPRNHDRLVPIGTVGELLVEGVTLSRGYMNEPEKTAAAFIKNPKWAIAQNGSTERRMYKTGDLVKFSGDGSMDLIFVGRKDTQAKVRGQRLELDEVELRLSTDPDVHHAVVTIPKVGSMAKKLVATLSLRHLKLLDQTSNAMEVITSAESTSTTSAIRERLRQYLPTYMVPTKWVVLKKLPLMPSGKLNRRQIATFIESLDDKPQTSSPNPTLASEPEVGPKVDVVDCLRKAWSHALNLPTEEINMNSSFLNHGGDSLSAMQVMARCRSQGLTVTVQDIIRSKSITELVGCVTVPKTRSIKAEDEEPFILSPIQQAFLDNVGDNWAQFNQSVLLKLTSKNNSNSVLKAMSELVKVHSMLRARFDQDNNGEWRQRITQDITGSLRFLTHNSAGSSNIGSLIETSQKALNIKTGPVIAVDLFYLEEGETQISIAIHHLVVDVVSWRPLLQDFENLLNNKPCQTGGLSFQTWSRMQADNAQQLNLEHVLPVSDIPTSDFDYWGMAGKENVYGDVLTDEFELSKHSTAQLIESCKQLLNSDPVDVLLAAVLLSFRMTFLDRRSSLAIFNEGHGREPWDSELDVSSTVGWFTTMSPIYLPNEADPQKAALLDAIQWVQDFRKRVPGKGQPYFASRFLTAKGKQRFATHSPIEAAFNYLGQTQNNFQKDSILQPAGSIDGQSVNALSDIGSRVPRFALMEISAMLLGETMKISFGYNKRMDRLDGIQSWLSNCKALIEEVPQCLQAHAVVTRQFSLLPLSYGTSGKLEEELKHMGVLLDDVEDAYPCSPAQEGILISQTKDPEKYAYHSIFEVLPNRANLTVDILRLETAWQTLVGRHSSLRTIFIDSLSGRSLTDQVVLKHFKARTVLLEAIDENFQGAFDTLEPLDHAEKQPPHRLAICRTANGRVVCKLEISHAISDGSSMAVLLEDLSNAYDSSSAWSKPPLYSDFISHLQAIPKDSSIGYWKNYLSEIEPCILPSLADYPPPTVRTARALVLNLDIGAQLQSFCMKHGFTPSNVLQVVWGLVLRAYTNSNEICFGYVSSGRDLPVDGIQEALGAFINILICRLNLADDALLGEILRKTQADFMEGMEFKNCSLAEVQHGLGLGDVPLFNTIFTFQKRSPADSSGQSALSFESLDANDPNEFNISVNVAAIGSLLEIDFGYWSDTLSDKQAENLAGTFEQILINILDCDADKSLGNLDLLGQQSSQQIRSWNAQAPKAVEKCVHELIEQNMRLRPRSTLAVCAWDATFTYSELESLASALSRHLIELGVGPDIYVPLCFEKSAWTIVAQLAVLKAGGAFVPLDPSHPDARLRSLIDDVGADLVLSSPRYSDKVDRVSKRKFIVDATTVHDLPKRPMSPPPTGPHPSNAAYVIFTSGTTGQPKGTVIEHACICTSALAHAEAFFMDNTSRVLQFASYTFDASIAEILTALIMGACICVPSDEDRMNDLQSAITKLQATWMFMTPSVLETLKPANVPTLKTIVIGGEAMTERVLQEWKGGPQLFNGYGPTETTVFAVGHQKVDQNGVSQDINRATIGTAIGCRLWVVDSRDYSRLMPVGAVGELVIEGRAVARGYLNNPKKSADVFIDNPEFTQDPRFKSLFSRSCRMYRTGDLVRYNPDGTISYISRKDTQIKLNGQRIELGEIEYHTKLNLPDQTHAAVDLIAPSDRAKKALAVFFTGPFESSGPRLTTSDGSYADELLIPMTDTARSIARSLEAGLTSSIPAYMIPQLYFPMSKLPWSTSGKLDRNRLRTIVQSLSRETIRSYRLTGKVNKRAAASPIESKLQSMWETVLGLPAGSVATGDNFFKLGGDSLSAMSLAGVARMQKISLSFANIFKMPVLSDMARSCASISIDRINEIKPFEMVAAGSIAEIKSEVTAACKVDEHMISDIYPCSPLQEGLVALTLKQPGAYVAQNIFRLSPQLDLEKFKAAWEAVVGAIDVLRTRVVHTISSNFLQVVLKEDQIRWHSASNLDEISDDNTKVPPFNGGNLTKYTIVDNKFSNSRHFVWTIHHALYDGWSFPLIIKQVERAYHGHSLQLPQISSYSRYIQYITSTDQSSSEEFWKETLSDTASINFPSTPTSAPSNTKVKTVTLSHTISIPGSQISTDVTIPTLIRAAWAIVIAAHTTSDDVCFGETLTGRNINVSGIADIMGPTLTTVPTRIRIQREELVVDFLRRVHQMAADVAPHQHIGLHHIRSLTEDTAAACNFQNLLVVQTAGDNATDDHWCFENSGDGQDFFTYPLVVECRAAEHGIEATVYFKENVFGTWMVQRLMDQLGFTFQQLYNISPTANMSGINCRSPEDRSIIAGWNRRTPVVIDKCIHTTFLDKADSQPYAPAICDAEVEMTYGELKDHASRLAVRFAKMGVGAEVLVPICLDKSSWMVVSIMAVLLAGGAFVPLDPSHPTSRHQEIVEETGAKIVVSSPQYFEKFSRLVGKVLLVDASTTRNLPPSALPSQDVKPNNSAYVIFTSGSTGRAKGIVIEHKAFNTCSAAFSSTMLMDNHSRVLQFASLSFDAAVMEILTTLTVGGCVCVPSEEERLRDIPGAIQRMRVTWTLLTPSVANIVDPDTVPCLKTLVCGGEALSPEVISKWADKVTLVNAYGPSESSVVACVNPRVSFEKRPTCIGKGVPSTLTWVLDPTDHNKLAPLGAAGELALDGPTLAREYLRNPLKTSEGFIEDPAWAVEFPTGTRSRRRIHKTGDLVRYNPDGSLEFIGRKDNQVKLHGQRMELGEIEHRLESDPRIRHILVLMPKSGACKKRLTAILSLKDSSNALTGTTASNFKLVDDAVLLENSQKLLRDVQSRLSDQLPVFMIPQVWAVVESIPLLSSGKLDRKRAASWIENVDDETYQQIIGTDSSDDSQSPPSGAVKLIQGIWSTVLNIPSEKVKLNQPFISLGGDSITAMAVISRCRKEKINLSLHDVLRSKSIVHLAEQMGNVAEPLRDEEVVDQPFNLSPIQQLYFQSVTNHDKASRFNQSFFLRLARYVSPASVRPALEAIVKRHSMLRARFFKNDAGRWQQSVSKEFETSYRYRLHSLDKIHDISGFIENSQTCLDIRQGPIVAADFFDIRDGGQFVFLVAHHLCVDMVSWRIILQDLQDYLETTAFSIDKPLSFQTWCLSQANHMHSITDRPLPFDIGTPNIGYWGMEGQENAYKDVDSRSFSLDTKTTSLALEDSRRAFQTEPVDLFLSAIAHSFSRVFKDREIPTLFNEGHGRESPAANVDPSRTVGWFTTIYPLVVKLGLGHTADGVLDTLKRTKDCRRSVRDSGHHHFAKTISSRSINGASRAPPMEVLFNYLGRMQQFERDDSLLQQADLSDLENNDQTIMDLGPDMVRFALFEVSAIVIRGQLRFSFMYNRNMRRTNDILRWISECKTTLEEMIDAMVRSSPEPTLSDYPLLPASYDGLKKLVKNTFPKAGITHRDQVEDIYPCAPMQEGIILSQIRDPASYLFNAMFQVKSIDPSQPVDAHKIGKSWQMVVDRHAALRTVFIDSLCKGSTFDQLVVKNVSSGVVFVECEDADVTNRLDAIKLQDTAQSGRPKLPHQLTVCRTTSGKVIIKIEINHAVIDGGSVSILMRDLAAAYAQQLPTGQGPLYSDYIRYITTDSATGGLTFWKEHLGGLKQCCLKSTGSQGPAERRLLAVHVNFNRYPEVQAMCEKLNVTLANFIHGAWALVLSHYTGSDDVCFGYLSAGRDAPVNGIHDAIGAFINMLCCRVQFQRGLSIAELIRNVQAEYLRSLPYQLCSLAQIQHELGLGGKPLFNTVLSIQNHAKSSDSAAEDLIFETLTAHDPSEYAVTVNVETAKGDEGIVLRCWSDCINATEAELLAKTMADSMTDLVDNPDKMASGSDIYHRNAQTQQQQEINDELPKDAEVRSAPEPPASITQQKSTLLPDNQTDLKKLIDTSVQAALQRMVESGALAKLSIGESASLVSSKLNESFDLKQHSSENTLEGYQNSQSTSNETILPDIHIQSMSPSPASDSMPNLFTKNESDSHSMAAHINRRGRGARVEKKLLRLWSSMLEMEEDAIAGDDSFFELGGDSLTAMKLVGAAREEGLTLTVADVFRNPVFEDMVTVIHVASMVSSYMETASVTERNVQSHTMRFAETSELYQRFSLVKAQNIDTFLQNSICPKIGVFKGGIADVLPVTDFQALAITGSLLESRWMLNYFFLDGNGSLDLRMLKRSCIRLVQASDILRTVFLPCGDRFLQVVLRKMRPDFFVYETESNLDDFMATLRERDREEGPRLGEPFVNFTVIKRKESDQHRIVIRISHAQYDGVSLPRILDALQSGYDNDLLPSISSFASYVRASADTVTSDHYQYWRGLLKGSRMTEVVRRKGPNYRRSAGETSQLIQSVLLPTIAQGNITMATVIKAAWALVLAQLSGSADIVFGHTISGRNASIPGVQSAVGPCLNVIPVRVQFSENWTALDLLRYIQDQQVKNMPYETLGFREITRHCTEWPDWTNFTTIVQHQSVSPDEELRLGRTTYKLGAVGADEDFSDFSVTSRPIDTDRCEIRLGFSQSGSITPIFAQKVLSMLCNTISTFVADPSTRLLSAKQISNLPAQTVEETNKPPASYYLSSQLEGLSRAEVLVLSELVTGAWRQVLGEEATKGLVAESSFFDLGGDIMSLAQIAWLLEQQGFKVRVEDLIDHPTMLGHMATLCSQQFPKQINSPEGNSPPTPLDERERIAVPRKQDKAYPLFKAMTIARRMVKRNTRPV